MAGGIDYGRIMLKAGHRVVADVLGEVAENGLPEENTLAIKFETDHPGVVMPKHLAEQYPDEMVILLDQWFDDLAVMGDRFQVTLSFSGVAETIVVPFAAIREFTDPSVRWGLAFHGLDPDEMPLDEAERSIAAESAEDDAEGPDAGADGSGETKDDGSTVVSLDSFRRNDRREDGS